MSKLTASHLQAAAAQQAAIMQHLQQLQMQQAATLMGNSWQQLHLQAAAAANWPQVYKPGVWPASMGSHIWPAAGFQQYALPALSWQSHM